MGKDASGEQAPEPAAEMHGNDADRVVDLEPQQGAVEGVGDDAGARPDQAGRPGFHRVAAAGDGHQGGQAAPHALHDVHLAGAHLVDADRGEHRPWNARRTRQAAR